MSVDVRPYLDLEPRDLAEWERLVAKAHSPDEARLGSNLRWADLDSATDFLLRRWEEDELCACAWVTQRTATVGDRATRVAGIRGVVTDPDRRRRGHGRSVMERAHELMRSLEDCEFALLFSSELAVPFYESLGWRAIRGPVTCDQPSGPINYTEALPTAPVMVLGLRSSAELPAGRVDVRGFPW